MFKNRIEFRNVGNLYGTNTIDTIISERDVEVRNKTTIGILEVLNEVIENRHTGIRTMINEMKKAKLPNPVFRNEREDFSVTFYNGEYPELYPQEIKNTQVSPQDNPQDNTQVKDRDRLILEFCKVARTAKEISEEFGYKDLKTFKKNHLKPLIDKGMLQMTIPDKPTSRNQKYKSCIDEIQK